MMHIGVDSRHVGATSDTPCHQPHHSPSSRLSLADEGASSVSSARVLSILCSRAHLSLCELEPIPNTRFLLVESLLQGSVGSGSATGSSVCGGSLQSVEQEGIKTNSSSNGSSTGSISSEKDNDSLEEPLSFSLEIEPVLLPLLLLLVL